MDIVELRKQALKKAVEIISIVTDDDFDFLNNLELIKFRIKSEESILNKCKKLNLDYDKVYDLIGIRFVVKGIDQCYGLLEVIKNNKQFSVMEIRDYIKAPKDLDEYKALHVHVKYFDFWCEIQIMDIDMHKLDEKTHDEYKLGLLTKES